MMMCLYSVFDSKTGVFCNPFCAVNDNSALRDFAYAARDPDTNIGKYPTDFSLFRLGNVSLVTGVLTPDPSPISLAVASSLLNSEV